MSFVPIIPDVLILSSLVAGGYQDYRTQQVSDLLWAPFVAGALVNLILNPLFLLPMGIIGSLTYYLGVKKQFLGIADIPAFLSLALLPSFLGMIIGWFIFVICALSTVAFRFLKNSKLKTYPFVTYAAFGFVVSILSLITINKF